MGGLVIHDCIMSEAACDHGIWRGARSSVQFLAIWGLGLQTQKQGKGFIFPQFSALHGRQNRKEKTE